MDTLGLTLGGNYRSEKENVDEDIAFLGQGAHRVEVDLMQPLDPERSPKVHSPPLAEAVEVVRLGLDCSPCFERTCRFGP